MTSIYLKQEGNSNLNCLPPARNLPRGGGGPEFQLCPPDVPPGGGSLVPKGSYFTIFHHISPYFTRGGGPKPDFVQNFGRLYLLNWMRHCFQIFTVCRPHKGLPVCWILKPSLIYVRSYGHLWYFHWSSHNFKNISLWAFRFGIQIVLGVPYNILKFEADMINTLGEIDIQRE